MRNYFILPFEPKWNASEEALGHAEKRFVYLSSTMLLSIGFIVDGSVRIWPKIQVDKGKLHAPQEKRTDAHTYSIECQENRRLDYIARITECHFYHDIKFKSSRLTHTHTHTRALTNAKCILSINSLTVSNIFSSFFFFSNKKSEFAGIVAVVDKSTSI